MQILQSLRRLTTGSILGAVASVAQAVTLDFESIAGMTYTAVGQPVPTVNQLSSQYLNSFGVLFSSGSSFVAVVNLGVGHATSGTNGIGGSTTAGALTYSSDNPIVATFFDPTSPATPAVTNFVSVRSDLQGSSSNVVLNAYDLAGSLIASATAADIGGETLSISASDIHSVRFLGSTGDLFGVALDDFTFNAVSVVPEPTTLVLFALGGLCLIVSLSRDSAATLMVRSERPEA